MVRLGGSLSILSFPHNAKGPEEVLGGSGGRPELGGFLPRSWGRCRANCVLSKRWARSREGEIGSR